MKPQNTPIYYRKSPVPSIELSTNTTCSLTPLLTIHLSPNYVPPHTATYSHITYLLITLDLGTIPYTAHNGCDSVLISFINRLHTASSAQDVLSMLRNSPRVRTTTPPRHTDGHTDQPTSLRLASTDITTEDKDTCTPVRCQYRAHAPYMTMITDPQISMPIYIHITNAFNVPCCFSLFFVISCGPRPVRPQCLFHEETARYYCILARFAKKNDGTRQNHDSFVNTLSSWLARARKSHMGGSNGKPRTCKGLFSRISYRLSQLEEARTPKGIPKVLQRIIPDCHGGSIILYQPLPTHNTTYKHQ